MKERDIDVVLEHKKFEERVSPSRVFQSSESSRKTQVFQGKKRGPCGLNADRGDTGCFMLFLSLAYLFLVFSSQ